MKLSTLLMNFALASAMSLTALPGFAADASSRDKGMSVPAQVGTPAEIPPPAGNRESVPVAPDTMPNAMGASDMSGSQSAISFDAVDGNKDGSITMGEYLKYGGTSESFRQSDKNNDNKLDSSELMTQ